MRRVCLFDDRKVKINPSEIKNKKLLAETQLCMQKENYCSDWDYCFYSKELPIKYCLRRNELKEIKTILGKLVCKDITNLIVSFIVDEKKPLRLRTIVNKQECVLQTDKLFPLDQDRLNKLFGWTMNKWFVGCMWQYDFGKGSKAYRDAMTERFFFRAKPLFWKETKRTKSLQVYMQYFEADKPNDLSIVKDA